MSRLASLREPSPLKLQRDSGTLRLASLAYALPAGPKSQHRHVQAHTWSLLRDLALALDHGLDPDLGRDLDLGKNAESVKLVHTGSARCAHNIPGEGTQGVLSYVPKPCPCPHSLNYLYVYTKINGLNLGVSIDVCEM